MAQYDIDFREYWRILKKRRMVVVLIAIALGIFSTSFAILKAPPPLYTSVCSVKFENQTPVEGLYASTISWSPSRDVATQISFIKSYAVFQKVAEKLGLIPRMDTKEDSPLKYNIIGIIGNLQTKVRVARQSIDLGRRELGTNVLDIIVTDPNPVLAQRLANTIALTYKELHAEQQMKRTTEAIKYIANQLKEERRKLRESEEEFNRFSQNNQLVSIDMQSERILAKAQEIQTEIQQLHADKRELEFLSQRLNRFIEKPSGYGRKFFSKKADSEYQATSHNLVELLLKRDTLLEDYTSEHPEVVVINRKIIENARKMVILLQLQVSEMGNKEIDLKKELEKIERKTNSLLDNKLEFSRLKREVELHNEMTILLEKKNQEALIKQSEKPEEVTIVKPALLPSKPTNSPKTAATGAMGVIIGLVVGLVIALIVETFDTSLGAIEDVEEILGTKVLGIVPQGDAKDIQENLEEEFPGDLQVPPMEQIFYLVSHFAPKSMMAENFRALRTNIQFKDAEKKIKTIAVTSTSPQEGKTVVSANLAIIMAQAGMKTLLIAADLRMPMIDRAFSLERAPGLTDILLGNYPWRETLKTITDIIMGKMNLDQVMITPGLDNLHIITSGNIPPNPADLLDSERLSDFIEEAKKEYDVLIFDSTPILSTADAAILGRKVGKVLLVYRLGSVSRRLLKRSAAQLEQVNCQVMGVILNGMRPEVSPDFHDYKYYKYHYSYGEAGKIKRDRKQKTGFLSIKRKRDFQESVKKNDLLSNARKRQQEQGRQHHTLRLFLTGIALALLLGGILWQNGLWDPFNWVAFEKPVKEIEIKRTVTKRIPKFVSLKETGVISVNPEAKNSPGKDGVGAETPSPPSESGAKEGLEVKERLSRPATSKGAGADSVKPKAKGPPGKPGKEIETPSPPSKPLANKGLEAKAKEMVKIETPLSSEKILSYPYSLYLGSFRTLERAKKAISVYSKRGLSPYWVKVYLKEKEVWYRVFADHFEDREKAERFRVEHGLTEIEVKETKYANLIGHYSDADELEKQINSLKDLGYSPYVIKDRDGRSRLFVGAFLPKQRAERKYHDLKSSGIRSQVVKR